MAKRVRVIVVSANSDQLNPSGTPGDESRRPISRPSAGDVHRSAAETLDHIRHKMESVADEFAAGRINRAQFDAVYGHYGEQRIIIERLIERNPDTDAWRSVARPGRTGFLLEHFEAKPVYVLVFRHRQRDPILNQGEQPPNTTGVIIKALKQLWSVPELPADGLARQPIGDEHTLVLASGTHAVSIVIFSQSPTEAQANIVRDLHADFERANSLSLRRKLAAEMMVFPQRALLAE